MKKKSASALDDADDRKRHEQPLQAVLLAEDWPSPTYGSEGNSSAMRWAFHPLVLDRPKILCPFVHGPMVDHVVSYLIGQGVQELYVVCTTKAVEDHLNQLSHGHHTMTIHVVCDTTVTNAGDALRELDKRNVIQSDPFVLIHGDCITNMDLSAAIRQHQERHAADSSAIGTLLLKAVGGTTQKSYAPLRSTADNLLIGLDVHNRILLYDNSDDRRTTSVPCSFYASHLTELVLRHDLLDIGLDLCSPDVLARFSDEFDYRHVRLEFVVNSVAEEEEGLQSKLYACLVPPSCYAARVSDARTYHAACRDVLRRCAHPLGPDTAPTFLYQCTDNAAYALSRHYLYTETTGRHRVGRRAVVTGPGLMGAHGFVGDQCRIHGSVLGPFVHVAAHCTIVDSHLWDGVHVHEGASVVQCILAHGVVVGAGAVLETGCIIGAHCVIGAGVRIPAYTRLTCSTTMEHQHDKDEWDDSEEEDQCVENVVLSNDEMVGPDGKGRVWQPPLDDEDTDENAISMELLLQSQCIGFDPQQIVAARRAFQTEDDDSLSQVDAKDMDDDYVTFDGTTTTAATSIIGRQEGVDVVKELKIICLEFEASTSPIENLAIELNSYKFSQNASYSDCTMAAMLAILEKMTIVEGISDGKLVTEFKFHLDKWAPLLQKMSVGLDEEKAIVLALEQTAVPDTPDEAARVRSQVLRSGMSFRLLLQMLHDQEIVSEEAILAWAADRTEQGEDGTPRAQLFRLQPLQDFLEWLDEESDEEDDEEE